MRNSHTVEDRAVTAWTWKTEFLFFAFFSETNKLHLSSYLILTAPPLGRGQREQSENSVLLHSFDFPHVRIVPNS